MRGTAAGDANYDMPASLACYPYFLSVLFLLPVSAIPTSCQCYPYFLSAPSRQEVEGAGQTTPTPAPD